MLPLLPSCSSAAPERSLPFALRRLPSPGHGASPGKQLLLGCVGTEPDRGRPRLCGAAASAFPLGADPELPGTSLTLPFAGEALVPTSAQQPPT